VFGFSFRTVVVCGVCSMCVVYVVRELGQLLLESGSLKKRKEKESSCSNSLSPETIS
jgi:hypothetical protein